MAETLHKLLKRLQYYLDEIATTPHDNLPRFLLMKKKAKKTIERIQFLYPNASFPVPGDSVSVRREQDSPVEGVMDVPDHKHD